MGDIFLGPFGFALIRVTSSSGASGERGMLSHYQPVNLRPPMRVRGPPCPQG